VKSATEVKNAFQKKRTAFIRLLSELVAARTENPPGDEKDAADVFDRFCASIKVPTRRIEKEPGRTNIIARLGTGAPTLLVPCHLDTVPAGEGWKTDPFEAVVKKGRIYGRGVCDNKGQLAACLLALSFLKRIEKDLSGSFVLIGAADEERGSARGMDYLVQKDLVKGEYAIVPDSADNMKMIDVTEKGALFLKITSHGTQAHGSTPQHGVNAIWNMLELLERLKKFKFPKGTHPLHSPPTLNLGAIEGGSAVNMVPARCSAEVDIRYLPGQTAREYIERINRAIFAVEKENASADFELTIMMSQKPSEVSATEPIVKVIQRCTKRIAGFTPSPIGLSGATLTKQLIERGIKAVGFAPGESTQPHAANESVLIREFLQYAAIVALIARELLGRK
jgi:acetylornithine deacetylase/succinyl-diaminopimelate desuccinylase family protein